MNKNERRDLIIDSAKKLFVEKGFHDTSVSDIIEQARIARSTFYAHFTGRMDIFQILVDRFALILLDSILSINISKAHEELPLARQIRDMSANLVEAIEKNRDLTMLLVTAQQGHDNDFDKSIHDFFAKILDTIKRLLLEGIEGRTIRTLDADIISYLILGSVKQLLLQWLVYKDINDIQRLLDETIRYNLFGIANGGKRNEDAGKAV